MAQLDPDVVGAIVGPIVVFPSIIVFTLLIMRYKLKKKELEMRGSNAELGPVVDALRDALDDTRAQLTDMQDRLNFTERLLAGRASQEDRSG